VTASALVCSFILHKLLCDALHSALAGAGVQLFSGLQQLVAGCPGWWLDAWTCSSFFKCTGQPPASCWLCGLFGLFSLDTGRVDAALQFPVDWAGQMLHFLGFFLHCCDCLWHEMGLIVRRGNCMLIFIFAVLVVLHLGCKWGT
jgi:hypothetical protein